jgi:uncharacterized protein (TIGR02145 family)
MDMKNQVMKLNSVFLFLTICLFRFEVYAQSGLNTNGQLDENATNVVNQYGAKGSGGARTQYGQLFSKAMAFTAVCDGTQPTAVVVVTSSTGRIWMDRNLGAKRAATAADDFEAYGCMYQWGRGNDGHASIIWTSSGGTTVNGITPTVSSMDTPGHALFITTTGGNWHSPTNNALWQDTAGVNNPCPPDFRLPTQTEFQAEITAYSITDKSTAYTNGILKLVTAGNRQYNNGGVYNANTTGNYWTSTTAISPNTVYFSFNNAQSNLPATRANGLSVRCIKEIPPVSPAICDGTQPTTVVEVTTGTGKTWMDRNLGASRAGINQTDYKAYGCLYQWGRGNDGHASINWSSSTAGTPVNGTTTTKSSGNTPGHALFISPTAGNDWRSTQNLSLWSGINGTNNPCPTGYRIPSLTELEAEYTSAGITNNATAFASSLKIVTAGWRYSGNILSSSSFSWIWTSDNMDGNGSGMGKQTKQTDSWSGSFPKFIGMSVRCIKN